MAILNRCLTGQEARQFSSSQKEEHEQQQQQQQQDEDEEGRDARYGAGYSGRLAGKVAVITAQTTGLNPKPGAGGSCGENCMS
eukprot:jgi/Mesen1/2300/ME000155S01394